MTLCDELEVISTARDRMAVISWKMKFSLRFAEWVLNNL